MTRTRHPNSAGRATTTTTLQTESTQQTRRSQPISGTLRLRGDTTTENNASDQRRIRWAEDVVDNEGQGKRSSKVCCIYHKSHPVGESSSESESSESDFSDSDSDGNEASRRDGRIPNGHNQGDAKHNHNHAGSSHSGHGGKPGRRKRKVNAYERVPHHNTQRNDAEQKS